MQSKINTILLTLVFLLGAYTAQAQLFSVKGHVNSADTAVILSGGTIIIQGVDDTAFFRNTTTDSLGNFLIPGLPPGRYNTTISYTGYDNGLRLFEIVDQDVDLGEIGMYRSMASTLGGVVVVGTTPPARLKEDTTEFNASAFKVNPDASTEDLLKKAPGIVIQNGQVTAQGETIQRVTLDGKDFFGDDATAALRNLPAELVDKIQVFDQQSDQARLTGVDDGNTVKAINIVTRQDMRRGQFGRLYAGYGTNERYAGGGNVNIFNDRSKWNIIGLFNNINQQNFSDQDLVGVSGGGGGRGGGGRGGGGGFMIGQQPGIATTNAIGINYMDSWLKEKMSVSGSYFFNNSNTDVIQRTNRETFMPGDSSIFYLENNDNNTRNYNHRANFRFEYRIDSNNNLFYRGGVGYQDNQRLSLVDGANRTSLGELINSSLNTTDYNGKGLNINNNLTYVRALAKRGRSISVEVSNRLNNFGSETYLDALSRFANGVMYGEDTLRQYTDYTTKSNRISAELEYNEPLSEKVSLQFSIEPGITKNSADQLNMRWDEFKGEYGLLDSVQSNVFDNTVRETQYGTRLSIGDRANRLSIGLEYQTTGLLSDQLFPVNYSIDRRFGNWLPNLFWRKEFSRQSNIRLGYRSSVDVPGVNQLQNVYNISNPLAYSVGNAELTASYTNFLFARFNRTNTSKGTNLFLGVFGQQENNNITTATWVARRDSVLGKGVVLRQGAQLRKPVNLDGRYSVRGFANYGFPLRFIKSNFNISAGVNYNRTPGLINNVENFSNSFTYNAGVNIGSNISEYVDFNINYNGNFSNVKNTIQPSLNNKYYNHSAGLRVNLLTRNGWFLLNDVSHQRYSGLADGFNQNFMLWNAAAGKKFLNNQRGELKLSVFDLLKQNQSISRTVGETYLQDVQTNVLTQYFLLTFTYTLRNFGKGRAAQSENPERGNFRGNFGPR